MVYKGCRVFIINLILIVFLNTSAGLAVWATPNSKGPSYLWEMNAPLAGPGMVEIYGEVTAISATKVSIDTGTRKYDLPLAPRTQISCNGLPSVWFALRPVTPEAFFEAQILINHQNEVVYINGMYLGEVCVLQSWRMEDDTLYLKLTGADNGQTCWRMVAPQAKIPQTNWLAEDIEIYVLYNYNQNIRAVFFPE